MNILIVATIVGGLLVDQHWARYGQAAVSAFTWLVLAALWHRSAPTQRPALFACLLFATAGEVFLSLVWGLYDYRLGNIPLFVPPGHVLLFFLGMRIAARIPDRGEWWVAAAALPLVALFAWSGRDTLGPLLYALFLACLVLSPSRKLYATMFVLSLVMELYGTWMGNWTWSPQVPWLGLTADNPPVAAGAFYCVLDLLVVSVTANRMNSLSRLPRLVFPVLSAEQTRLEEQVGGVGRVSQPASPMSTPSIVSHQAATFSARSSSR